MRLRYILIVLSLFLLSGCTDIYILENENSTNTSFWFEDTINTSVFTGSNESGNMSVLRYDDRNVFIVKNLSTNDLFVRAGNSIHIGGPESAIISAENINFPAVTTTLISTTINSGFASVSSFNGSKLLTNLNTNMDPEALAITSAGDIDGNGMALFKRNVNHEEPYLGQVLNLKGNLDLMTTQSNNDSLIGSNKIRIGFYTGLEVTNNTAFVTVLNKTSIIELNQTQITLFQETNIEENLYFKQLNSTEIPDEKIGYVAMYCKPNEKCYFKRGTGQERRILDAVGGSFHLDESTYFNTSTIVLEHSSYAGSGNRFVCIDTNEQIFVSSTSCN